VKLTLARKEHTCMFCFRPIAAGTLYLREGMGPWCSANHCYTFKAHPPCKELWSLHESYEGEWHLPGDRTEWLTGLYDRGVEEYPLEYLNVSGASPGPQIQLSGNPGEFGEEEV